MHISYAFDCDINHHINFIVQITEQKLQQEGWPSTAQTVMTLFTFANPEFCNIVHNIVSSATELQMQSFDLKIFRSPSLVTGLGSTCGPVPILLFIPHSPT